MKRLLITEPKSINTATKKKLEEDGILVVETKNPAITRLIETESAIETNDLLMSALKACTVGAPTGKAETLVNDLYRRLKEKEEPKIESGNRVIVKI